jgi:hypothetical protein
MAKIDDVVSALESLATEGATLLADGQKPKMELGRFAPAYEAWYTKANAAIAQIAPERLADFRDAYRNDKRKEITYATYTVSDYLHGLIITRGGERVFNTTNAFAHKLLRQTGIVAAAAQSARSVLRDLRAELQAEILDSDVAAARELMKAGHLRSAGVVCGVALEAHLGAVAERRGVPLKKKDPSIADYNDALKGANAYDTPVWRFIQRLGDIRNLCGHKKDRDPTRDEAEDLITGTDKVIREVF